MIARLNAYLFYARLTCNLLPLLAFTIAELVRFGRFIDYSSTDYEPIAYVRLLLVATVVWSIIAEHYELAGGDSLFIERTGLLRIVAACGATYLVLFTGLFFYRELTFSRIFLVVSAASLFVLTFAMRHAVRTVVRKKTAGLHAVRLLLIGSDEYAARLAKRLTAIRNPACRVIAYVQLPGQEVAVDGAPVVAIDQIHELAIGHQIDDIIVSIPPSRWHELGKWMPAIERLSAPVRAVLDLGPGIEARDRLFRFGSVSLIDLSAAPLDKVEYFLLKRAVDVLLASVFVVLTLPFMLAIAVAVRLSSRGPVLFVQDRVGLNGKVFRMYKFRTMRVAPPGDTDTHWTTPHDQRCTRLGALLRRTSLDELPQFFNVLRGDMSVVGPRPERPHFVRKFLQDIARYNSRHQLKVGITGWAQVNGLRGDTSIPERVEHDLYYLQNWSLGLDLRIILMTVWTSLFGRNAY